MSDQSDSKPHYDIDHGPLTDQEKTLFASLREKVRKAVHKIAEGYQELGAALIEIRDKRLYREEFGTFELYCQADLGKSKRHINRLISAYDFTQQLLSLGVPEEYLPDGERLVRELSLFPAADAAKILKNATKMRLASGQQKLTQLHIREAARSIEGASPSVREKQIRELTRRFERIQAELQKVDFGWGDMPPETIEKLRTLLADIIAICTQHLQGVPKEFKVRKTSK